MKFNIKSKTDINRLFGEYDFDQMFRVVDTGEEVSLANLSFAFDHQAPGELVVEAM